MRRQEMRNEEKSREENRTEDKSKKQNRTLDTAARHTTLNPSLLPQYQLQVH